MGCKRKIEGGDGWLHGIWSRGQVTWVCQRQRHRTDYTGCIGRQLVTWDAKYRGWEQVMWDAKYRGREQVTWNDRDRIRGMPGIADRSRSRDVPG